MELFCILDTYSIFGDCGFYLSDSFISFSFTWNAAVTQSAFCRCFFWITTLSLVKYFTSPFFLWTTVSSAIPNTVLICSNCDCRVTGQWKAPALPWPSLTPSLRPGSSLPHGFSITSKAILLVLLCFSTDSLFKLQKPNKSLYLHPTYCCLSSHLEIGARLGFFLINRLCEVYCLVWLPTAKILLGHKKPYSDHSYKMPIKWSLFTIPQGSRHFQASPANVSSWDPVEALLPIWCYTRAKNELLKRYPPCWSFSDISEVRVFLRHPCHLLSSPCYGSESSTV